MRSMLAAARQMALDFETLMLPMACLGCQRPAGRGRNDVLCQVCRYSMRPIAAPKCARCGQTLDAWEKAGGKWLVAGGKDAGLPAQPPATSYQPPASCGFCKGWPPALTWAASAVWFDDVPRELAHGLKYSGWTVAAGPMAQAMARHLAERLRGAELLVPVPLGRRRLRERGYNQAAVLSEALSQLTGIPSGEELERTRDTRTQTALDPKARRENVAGAFRVSGGGDRVSGVGCRVSGVGCRVSGVGCRVSGATVVLVDDVLTTGATLGAAAEALAAAGATQVGAVTFARAAKPE